MKHTELRLEDDLFAAAKKKAAFYDISFNRYIKHLVKKDLLISPSLVMQELPLSSIMQQSIDAAYSSRLDDEKKK